VFGTVLALSVFYWTYSHYKFTGVVAAKKTMYLADVYNWRNNRNMFSVERSIVQNGNFYLLPAYEKGFFSLPKAVVEKNEVDAMFAGKGALAGDEMYLETWDIERVVRDGVENLTYYFVASNIKPVRKHFWDNRFLVLRNSATGASYLLNANPKVDARRNILTSGHYYKTGFNSLLRPDDLDAGTYDLGILDVTGAGQKTFYRLDKSLLSTGDGFALK
jgi:hypothetical protein